MYKAMSITWLVTYLLNHWCVSIFIPVMCVRLWAWQAKPRDWIDAGLSLTHQCDWLLIFYNASLLVQAVLQSCLVSADIAETTATMHRNLATISCRTANWRKNDTKFWLASSKLNLQWHCTRYNAIVDNVFLFTMLVNFHGNYELIWFIIIVNSIITLVPET